MRHYNPTIGEDSVRLFNLKTGDALGEIIPVITPVIPIVPRINIIKRASALNATSATVYTTPTDKDFYLTNACLSVIKDVTSTSTSSTITAVVDGTTVNILEIASITLTVQENTVSQKWDGLKLDRGSNINVTNSTNVANIRASACIQGYTVETVKGV